MFSQGPTPSETQQGRTQVTARPCHTKRHGFLVDPPPPIATEMEWRGTDCCFDKGTMWRGGVDAEGKPHGNSYLFWPEEDSREYSAGAMVSGRMEDCWLIKYRGLQMWRKVHKTDNVDQDRPQVILTNGFLQTRAGAHSFTLRDHAPFPPFPLSCPLPCNSSDSFCELLRS